MSRVLYQSLPIDVSMYKGVSQPCIDIAQQMKYLPAVCTKIVSFLSLTVLCNRLSSILETIYCYGQISCWIKLLGQ